MKRTAIILMLLLAGLAGGLWTAVWLSRPALDGQISVAGLDSPVEIARDTLGVPTITAQSRRDLAFATGFAHAQDRFFQMDLLRRVAAGELSALFGPAALDFDRDHRRHRFRAAAAAMVPTLPARDASLLDAYTEGVNAGLATLTVRPFEYLLLRMQPKPWRVEDTLLVNYAMYFDLNDDDGSRDASFGLLHDALPPALEDFLLPEGTDWDAPLLGAAWEQPALPGPDVCDMRSAVTAARAREASAASEEFVLEPPMAGSNAWTVAASRSETGRAIVANDMHLELTEPNVWYRMRWIIRPANADESPLDITGVTLPGAPAVVAGSNGSVAWGFTNSYGDWSDLVILEQDPADPDRYRTADGWRELETHEEIIEVRGQDPVVLDVRSSVWGPVIDTDRLGRLRAVHWLAHEPSAVNLRIVDLERAQDVDEAIEIAHSVGSPPQNIMLADSDGNIAWTIMGRIPLRVGYDPRLPASWAKAGTGWQGWLASQDYPLVKNPSTGFLWTANARTVDGTALERIGRGGFDLGARARQIRDRLAAIDRASVGDMLEIQLDDSAMLHRRWGELLLETLRGEGAASSARRAELAAVLASWDGRAGVTAAGYRLARAFRQETREELLSQIVYGCGSLDGPIQIRRFYQTEGPVWRLVNDEPAHLLPAGYTSWTDFLLAMADRAIASCGEEPLEQCSWGEINRVEIRHPLARALPPLSRWLTVNATALPGGQYTPRVQQGLHGATERFAVSPGDERNGYFHMPGGQSGHPMSPYFRAGHDAWVRGEPSPFLPGPNAHVLSLEPTESGR